MQTTIMAARAARDSSIQVKDKGVDNPGATLDDDTNIRPDLVISVQPQAVQGDSRAVLPVPTTDWRSNPRGQFIPVHGLDFLIGVSSLVIHQTVELDDLTSKIESENRYTVRVPQGEALYIASEQSKASQRCLCGSGRAFVMHLHDNTRQEALQLRRRLAGATCCFPCRLQEMHVITPPGDYLGRIQQQWTFIVPFYLVRDANDDVLFVIEGPAIKPCTNLINAEFKIMSGDALREEGRIVHAWNRELVNFTTTVHLPDRATQPKHKALLLGAAFLMEITTNINKWWSYDEYYIGDANNIGGSTGYKGENHWSSAKSLESYVGAFLQGTMHGRGEYRWRYYGEEGTASTYEGYFYANQMHGYGTFSYEDGTVFDGLFYNNHRWGPGILHHPNVTADVGIWCGHQLVRLAWSPPTAAVIPNLNVSPMAAKLIAKHRIKLRVVEDVDKVCLLEFSSKMFNLAFIIKITKNIFHNAAEVTTHEIVDTTTNKKLEKLILANAKTAFFNKYLFDRNYYDGVHKQLLEEISAGNGLGTPNDDDQKESPVVTPLYNAWNNSCMMVALMKHCYEHDRQKDSTDINLEQILSGPRRHFKPVAAHELNCRTLLMASFLGHTSIVAQLVIDSDVHPNVADVVGNTALMYATRGDMTDTIDFLMEAGAKMNDYNDSGCTALGIALIRFVAITKNIQDINVVDFITPPNNIVDNFLDNACDWNLNRNQSHEIISSANFPSMSKINSKKIKSSISMKSVLSIKKRRSNNSKEKTINENEDIDNNDLCDIYKALHKFISQEYLIRVSDIFGPIEENKPANIFDCVNMIEVIENADISKNNIPVKNINSKTTKEAVLQNDMNRLSGISIEQRKIETLSVIKQTILMLLTKGANPKAVIYPLPPLLMAVISSDAHLVKNLLKYGAEIHQTCPEILNYTALEYAIAQPLTIDNLEVIKALLEGGSKTNECLHYEDGVTGPTLLHAVLAKTVENDLEKDVQVKLINLLLNYGSDSTSLFKGQSAVGVAITKYIDLLAVFTNNPKVNLNAVIDDDNHTILAKIFDFNFFILIDKSKNLDVMLLNLLKYGANPLLKYRNDLESYENIFVFINKQIMEIENSSPSTNIEAKNNKGKTKSNGIPKNKSNALVKTIAISIDEFKKAVEIMSEFSRNSHKRWLQSGLTMELIEIVKKFKHRSWHMIIKKHKQKKQVKLWLTAPRCLEIWSILWVNQKICNDRKVLELLLCIVHCYNLHQTDNCNKITFDEKTQIEKDVKIMMKNYVYEEETDSRSVVKPELGYKKNKFNSLCFECSLPLSGTSIKCPDCQVVSFCQIECIRQNKERTDCHPCSCEGILQDLENKIL